MTLKLKPIKPKRISDQVFEQLREHIFRGNFKPGEKIMPERELSAALNVSRSTVRDAINKLVFVGLLEHKQGQGTFVSSPGGGDHEFMAEAMRSQNATLRDLLEMRMSLEYNTAMLAAQRATDEDIAHMASSLEKIDEEMAAGRVGAGADISFHMAIAYASRNPIQIYIMKHFYDFLFYGIKENLIKLYKESGGFEDIGRQHQAILDAIKNHDPHAAYMATKEHIEYVIMHLGDNIPDPHVMQAFIKKTDKFS